LSCADQQSLFELSLGANVADGHVADGLQLTCEGHGSRLSDNSVIADGYDPMQLRPGSERVIASDDTDPLVGNVRWSAAKSLWIGTMTALAIILGPLFFSWDALILFMATGDYDA